MAKKHTFEKSRSDKKSDKSTGKESSKKDMARDRKMVGKGKKGC